MNEEYAYKGSDSQWVPGYESRSEAIAGGLKVGLTQITTAKVYDECPSYFARFESKSILDNMIAGLRDGERRGKLLGGYPAIECISRISEAEMSFQNENSPEFLLRIDLMNRLQDAVTSWVVENSLPFEYPKFFAGMTEELHVAGAKLNIPIL